MDYFSTFLGLLRRLGKQKNNESAKIGSASIKPISASMNSPNKNDFRIWLVLRILCSSSRSLEFYRQLDIGYCSIDIDIDMTLALLL